jgi:hypothetical protein
VHVEVAGLSPDTFIGIAPTIRAADLYDARMVPAADRPCISWGMLQAAHATVPWIVTPDDHEVFGPRGHQPEVHEKKTL